MRRYKKFNLIETSDFREHLLAWINKAESVAFLNSNHLDKKYGSYDFLCAVGVVSEFICPANETLPAFKNYFSEVNDWLFGFFSYDLKNELENLTSVHEDGIQMPLLHFFQPQLVFLKKKNALEIGYISEFYSEKQINNLFTIICNTTLSAINNNEKPLFEKVVAKVEKDTYLEKITKIKNHIQIGDIYEMNFCMEFYANYHKDIDIVKLYKKLNSLSPAPFSCLYVSGDKSLICASPERFLKKEGNRLISQPIKGTIKRGKTEKEDAKLARELASDEKEKSENVMIVDLVRNDLSHYALKGSVKVEELFGMYSFAQVHQMISTVVCNLKEDACIVDAIMQCFPPGSMTGAPKIRAMQIIEDIESTKRGLYAGAVGYFTPKKDFDFNVVIRSILINDAAKYVSLMAGGAITAKSEAEKEYDECLVKAQAMIQVLTQ